MFGIKWPKFYLFIFLPYGSQIHDGGLLTSPLLGSLTCNDTVLSDWTTTQNFMLIHLKTRGYTLNASYETARTYLM